MMLGRPGKSRRLWLVLFALAACLAAEALLRGGVLNPVDQRLQDFWFQWQGVGRRLDMSVLSRLMRIR